MYLLRILGGALVEAVDGPLTGRVTQRRRLALLAVLAVARDRPVSRDRLLALFWPERSSEDARPLLSDSLYIVRKDLGEEALLASGGGLLLNPAVVHTDVGEFEQALRDDDPERAVAVYAGPLLDGFHLDGCPEFERWLDGERERLAGAYGRALQDLAEWREASGDPAGAVHWWRRLSAHEPASGAVAVRLMLALEGAGDRAGALQHAAAHARLLDEEYGLPADPEVAALVERLQAPVVSGPGAVPHPAPPRVTTAAGPLPPRAASATPTHTFARRRRRSLPYALPLGVGALVILGVLAVLALVRVDSPDRDEALIAVIPFSVSGSDELGFLREGMVDLLAAKLTGEGGPRAVDPRAVLNLVRRAEADPILTEEAAAAGIGRRLGAGQVLLGSVVGTLESFTIDARIVRVPDGRVLAQESETASGATLFDAIDRLVVKLLALRADEGPERLAVLTTTSLPALRSYLEGQSAYRQGDFEGAAQRFARALSLDSTFALAALGHWAAAYWADAPQESFVPVLARNRHRLGPIDRAIADLMVSRDEPRSWRDRLKDWEAVLARAPDRADVWFWYGDAMHHFGVIAGFPDALERSDRALSRALELDSSYLPALFHRIDNALHLGRIDLLRQLDSIRVARDSYDLPGLFHRPATIRYLGDSAAIRAERAALDTMHVFHVRGIVGMAPGTIPGSVDDALGALDELMARATTVRERREALQTALRSYLRFGMPSRAQAAAEELLAVGGDTLEVRMIQLLAAVFWDGDPAAGSEAAARLSALLETPDLGLEDRIAARCALGMGRLMRGEIGSYAADVRELRGSPKDSAVARNGAEACARTLETLHALLTGADDLSERAQALDQALLALLRYQPVLHGPANLVLARAAERAGDLELAYRATTRRPLVPGGLLFESAMRREQARLARRLGDLATAETQERRYLLLHERAEPLIAARDAELRRDRARAGLASRPRRAE